MLKKTCLVIAGLALLLIGSSALSAQGNKGGGKGGGKGGAVPPGVLYVYHLGDVYSMKPNGKEQTFLFDGQGLTVEPSHGHHGGLRWFLQFRPIAGQTYPDGVTRHELFAINECGKLLQLSNDPNLQFAERLKPGDGVSTLNNSSPRWAPDDSSVGYAARLWHTDPVTAEATIVERGIYSITFATNVAEMTSPVAPTLLLELEAFANGFPDLFGFDWSPDQSRLTYNSSKGHFIVDLATGLKTQVSDGARNPRWSPDGSMIVYLADGFVNTMDVVTGAVTPIKAWGSAFEPLNKGRIRHVLWAPSSAHLTFRRFGGFGRGGRLTGLDSDIFRMTATGSEETRLKVGLDFAMPIGWRSVD